MYFELKFTGINISKEVRSWYEENSALSGLLEEECVSRQNSHQNFKTWCQSLSPSCHEINFQTRWEALLKCTDSTSYWKQTGRQIAVIFATVIKNSLTVHLITRHFWKYYFSEECSISFSPQNKFLFDSTNMSCQKWSIWPNMTFPDGITRDTQKYLWLPAFFPFRDM